MAVIALDLGGTKLATAVFNPDGTIEHKEVLLLFKKQGKEVGELIQEQIRKLLDVCHTREITVDAIGVSIPGIWYSKKGTVWAPNIPGWDNYPLLEDLESILNPKEIKVKIDSDRACYILGETWLGAAKGCKNAIFLAFGTGIGAGILIDGRILRGASDIAGAIGWLALERPFHPDFVSCGCFESQASGEGIAKVAQKYLEQDKKYQGILSKKDIKQITSRDIFEAYKTQDSIAVRTLNNLVELCGMTVANLVSLFNPEKIIMGGGVFGPATSLIPEIKKEALKWAQPISIHQVSLEVSILGGDAGLFGAGKLALLPDDMN